VYIIPNDAVFDLNAIPDHTASTDDRVEYTGILAYFSVSTHHAIVPNLAFNVALDIGAVVAIKMHLTHP